MESEPLNFLVHTSTSNSSKPVHTIASSHSLDVDILVTGSTDRKVRFIKSSTGRELKTCEGHKRSVMAVAVSQMGLNGEDPIIVSAGREGAIIIWDATQKTLERIVKLPVEEIRCIAVYQGSESYLLVGTKECKVLLWDLKRDCVKTLFEGHKGCIHCVCICSAVSDPDTENDLDFMCIASGSADRSVRLWDFVSPKKRKKKLRHARSIGGVAIACKGIRPILASGGSDHLITLWDVDSGLQLQVLEGHLGPINQICFWEGYELLVISASADRTIRIFDALTGECVCTLIDHSDDILGLAITANVAPMIVSCSLDYKLNYWDLEYIISEFYTDGARNEIPGFNPEVHYSHPTSFEAEQRNREERRKVRKAERDKKKKKSKGSKHKSALLSAIDEDNLEEDEEVDMDMDLGDDDEEEDEEDEGYRNKEKKSSFASRMSGGGGDDEGSDEEAASAPSSSGHAAYHNNRADMHVLSSSLAATTTAVGDDEAEVGDGDDDFDNDILNQMQNIIATSKNSVGGAEMKCEGGLDEPGHMRHHATLLSSAVGKSDETSGPMHTSGYHESTGSSGNSSALGKGDVNSTNLLTRVLSMGKGISLGGRTMSGSGSGFLNGPISGASSRPGSRPGSGPGTGPGSGPGSSSSSGDGGSESRAGSSGDGGSESRAGSSGDGGSESRAGSSGDGGSESRAGSSGGCARRLSLKQRLLGFNNAVAPFIESTVPPSSSCANVDVTVGSSGVDCPDDVDNEGLNPETPSKRQGAPMEVSARSRANELHSQFTKAEEKKLVAAEMQRSKAADRLQRRLNMRRGEAGAPTSETSEGTGDADIHVLKAEKLKQHKLQEGLMRQKMQVAQQKASMALQRRLEEIAAKKQLSALTRPISDDEDSDEENAVTATSYNPATLTTGGGSHGGGGGGGERGDVNVDYSRSVTHESDGATLPLHAGNVQTRSTLPAFDVDMRDVFYISDDEDDDD